MRLLNFAAVPLFAVALNSLAFAADAPTPDPRLADKISIDCVNTRLHTAVEKIASHTGVTINTGINKDEWTVRDVPVIVCARDIPLGNLLKGIADATHLLWSKSTVKDETKYRIWRDNKRKDELEAYTEANTDYLVDAVSYDWDTLCLASAPEENKAAAGFSPMEKAAAQILAELGPEAKDKVLDGGQILLFGDEVSAAMEPHFNQLLKTSFPDATIDDESARNCYVKIWKADYSGKKELRIDIRGPKGVTSIQPYFYELLARQADPSLPARPAASNVDLAADKLDTRYVRLELTKQEGPEFLDKKVTVTAPKDQKSPRYSDLIAGLSKEIEYSIVAEGAAARWVQKPTEREQLATMFGREITAREVLLLAEKLGEQEWYLDEQSELILGRDKGWVRHLEALVPEKLLVDLQKKISGQGIEIDDLAPLVNLSKPQISEWMVSCPEYPELGELYGPANFVTDTHLGNLYFALTPEERVKAKRGLPVSLLGIDQEKTASLLSSHLAAQIELALTDEKPNCTDLFSCRKQVADPDSLPALKLSLGKINVPKPFEGKYKYYFQIEGFTGNGLKISQQMNGLFPVTASKEEEE